MDDSHLSTYFTLRCNPTDTGRLSPHPGGKDHFYWMTGDAGACYMPPRFMDKPIKVRSLARVVIRGRVVKMWQRQGGPGNSGLACFSRAMRATTSTHDPWIYLCCCGRSSILGLAGRTSPSGSPPRIWSSTRYGVWSHNCHWIGYRSDILTRGLCNLRLLDPKGLDTIWMDQLISSSGHFPFTAMLRINRTTPVYCQSGTL